ncbi:TldD/PmbA family protein [bacterium]|nr:TldD/PmbA family protein [bacterium]
MKEFTDHALNVAEHNNATYADIRILKEKNEFIMTKNGQIGKCDESESYGFGVRVIVDGSWGFASSGEVSKAEIERVTELACRIAKSSAKLSHEPVVLAPEDVYVDRWYSHFLIDPFAVPFEKKLELLFEIDKILRKSPKINIAEATMGFEQEHQYFASSEGSFIEQKILQSGVGYSATAVEGSEVQRRSYPTSFGRQNMQCGYELVESLELVENAERIREEAVGLLTARQCPSGRMDLILEGSQLALQIHESCGHPSELDRVIGMEANYAGTSFLTTEKYRTFKYGSPIVNIVADGTIPGGLATVGYDDDGVRSQRWFLVNQGITWGYLTNRELAHIVNEPRSKGCNRADGWVHLPMVRMTNISLSPGDWEYDDLIADTKDGILMEINKSWSIDQRRLNFQFGCEIGWLIKNGKITEMVKNPTYQGITPEFWGNCDAISNEKYWTLWGVNNCGKGQPGQRAQMSHGASPARFRNVEVGIDK